MRYTYADYFKELSTFANETAARLIEREALRWTQIESTRNSARYEAQGDPQYDTVLEAAEAFRLSDVYKDFSFRSAAPIEKGKSQLVSIDGVTTHVTAV